MVVFVISPHLHPGQGEVHREHVHPHLQLALLYPRLVRVVEGACLHVLGHQTRAHTWQILPVMEDTQGQLLHQS